MKLFTPKKIVTAVLFSFVLLISCGKKETNPQTDLVHQPTHNQEDITSANAMHVAFSAMSHYNDSLAHHAPDQHHVTHYDSLYHHHDSLFWHHHTQYHHQDTSHHAHHPQTDHHALDSLHHHHDLLDSLNHLPHHHSH